MVGEDEIGLQDGQGLGMGVGAGLMDDDIQRSAVVLNSGHLHVLLREGGTKSWGDIREIKQQEREIERNGKEIGKQRKWD